MATTYDKASLVMIPSGVKESKLYSIKPTSGDGDFTFSRGTDTATRVNSSGLIEKERGNLTTWSNDLDNWTKVSASVTSGQTGYDGSNDAWRIDSTAGFVRRDVSYSGVNTFSIYAKAGTAVGIRIRLDAASDKNAYFNLSTGAEISHTGISLTATDLGSGWYRIAFAADISTGINYRIYAVDASGTSTTGSIYVQDAQLEQGLVATDYIETTTAAVYEGITDNLPRLDYSGGASCPSLLLEPSRTNQITNSEYFNGADWINVDVTATENAAISPEGVQNASQLDFTGTTYKRFEQNTSNAATACTASIFMKYIDHAIVMARMDSTTGASYAWFDIRTGEVLKVDGATGSVPDPIASVDDYGDGWYRLNTTQTAMAATQEIFWYFVPDINTSTGGWTGSGSAYAYGAQFEEGSYATSYIPTYGTSASRAADEADCSDTGITSNVGTWYIEFGELNSGSFGSSLYSILINPSSGSEYISFLSNQTQNTLRVRVNDGTTTQYVGGSFSIEAVNKYLIKWDGTNLTFFRNGSQYASVLFNTSKAFSVMNLPNPARAALYPTKQILCFPTALTDAEAIALTTI